MSVQYDFSGRVALVTGAGKGIGREISVSLVNSGAKVIAVSRTQSDLDSLIEKYGSEKVVGICMDISDIASIKDKFKDIGPVDMLVNNAGYSVLESFLDVTPDAYDKIMNINHKAMLFVSQVIAQGMKERGKGGVILNVSSKASHVALDKHTVYCSSKAAVDMLTKVMGMELGQYNIRVNSINPTVVLTDMGKMAWSDPVKSGPMLARIPLNRFAEVQDIAQTALYLLSDHSAMITCESVLVDGGYCAS